jgi:hypothetical protein
MASEIIGWPLMAFDGLRWPLMAFDGLGWPLISGAGERNRKPQRLL